MIVSLTFVNPIINNIDYLNIEYPTIEYEDWKSTKDCSNDKHIINILDNLLSRMDCSRVYNNVRFMMTSYFNYTSKQSEYVRYLLKLDNQLLYNTYVNKLINKHIENIVFEYENPIVDKVKTKSTKKKVVLNKYYKFTSKDIFTGKTIYRYENPATKDVITSDSPNLLDELNNTKKKTRKKSIKINKSTVSMKSMTFNFNIK